MTPSRSRTRPREDLAGLAYRRIKDLILRYEFRPGQKLTQDELARRLGVSLTPVREALRFLEQEGYVTQVRNRGFYVGEISLKEAEDFFELREALEMLAVEKAVKNRDEAFIAALEACLGEYARVVKQSLTRQRIMIDQRFHLLIARQADNDSLVRTLQYVFDRITLKRTVEGASPTRGAAAYDEHVEILAAIRAGDAVRARELAGAHARNAKHAVLEQLRDRQSFRTS
jgi:DNA-binding GntR family transcriptional regulator